jgi:hypothetical protein
MRRHDLAIKKEQLAKKERKYFNEFQFLIFVIDNPHGTKKCAKISHITLIVLAVTNVSETICMP